jgi:hypothetical protein
LFAASVSELIIIIGEWLADRWHSRLRRRGPGSIRMMERAQHENAERQGNRPPGNALPKEIEMRCRPTPPNH